MQAPSYGFEGFNAPCEVFAQPRQILCIPCVRGQRQVAVDRPLGQMVCASRGANDNK